MDDENMAVVRMDIGTCDILKLFIFTTKTILYISVYVPFLSNDFMACEICSCDGLIPRYLIARPSSCRDIDRSVYMYVPFLSNDFIACEICSCDGLIPRYLIARPSSCRDIDRSLFVSKIRNNSLISEEKKEMK